MAEMLIDMRGIIKNFIGVKALKGVSFNVRAGEVHALLGENGAGKSTLMKILTGAYQPDEGDIVIRGQKVDLKDPNHARQLGISIVHQEPQMVPTLSIAENVCLGAWPVKNALVSWKEMLETSRRVCERIGLKRSMSTLVEELSMAEKQMVQIARALLLTSRVLILDEPTSSLTPQEKDLLFGIIRKLRSEGMGLVYISHRMEEIFEIADRVTVLKDGEWVNTMPIGEIDTPGLIRMMVGREMGKLYPPKAKPEQIGETVLEVKGFGCKGVFHDVSFTLRKGEVLGFAGLVGSGRSEVALSLFGAAPHDTGTVTLSGKPVRFSSPADAIRHRLALVGEDRHEGMVHVLSVMDNITMPSYRNLAKSGVINRKKQRKRSVELIEQLNVRTPHEEQEVGKLSGGNQQKVIFARWLMKGADILILDEPTRGIDVGAKEEIYQLIRKLTGEGKSVILISSELPEVLGMSDRVLVMHNGTVSGILDGETATEEQITQLALGVV